MFGRDKIAMIAAEFIGTFTLASVVLALVIRTPFPFFVAVSAGAVLGLMSLTIGNVSGAHLNPAVTFGLWWIRQIKALKAVAFILVQLLAGLVAFTLNEWLLDQSLPSRAGDEFLMRVFVSEIIGTAIFTFGVAAAVLQRYKGLKNAFTVGGSLSLGILVASFAGNALLNPAVAVGVQSWSSAYVGGPVVGSLIGMSLYVLLFAPRPARAAKAAVTTAKTTASARTAKKPAKQKPAAKKKSTRK